VALIYGPIIGIVDKAPAAAATEDEIVLTGRSEYSSLVAACKHKEAPDSFTSEAHTYMEILMGDAIAVPEEL